MTEDMISALPDDLLLKILLRIPTEEAIATMILSKSWLFIWTMLSELEYEDDDVAEDKDNDDDDDDNGKEDEESKKSVWLFLNKSMELHKAPLEILTIKLNQRCPTDANVCKCLETAVKRGLRELTFELQWSADPIRLPESLYMCKTLVHLYLYHKIIVDFPSSSSSSSSSCLPSLTKLVLHYVVYQDEASLVTFLSSCSVLKALWVKRRIKGDNVDNYIVKVPSLLVLIYNSYNKPSTDEVDHHNGRSLVVDTPALQEFCIANHSRDSFLIESLPCLNHVSIEGKYVPDIDSYRFFKSLSNVLSIELILTDEMVVRFSNIKFSRLTKCNISPCNSDWMDSLVFLLHNTPKLKHFIVDYRLTTQPPIASATWMERIYEIPECLSSSLEKFKVIKYEGRVEEQELVEYFLVYSKCLKKATISLSSFKDTEKDKHTMVEKLESIPKLSIASQLLFKNYQYAEVGDYV